MIPVHIIVAIDEKLGIGKNGDLPWHLTGDLKFFRDTTCTTESPEKQNIVLMGRKTWQSIPKQFQPLHERINVVLTQNPNFEVPYGVLKGESFAKVLEMVRSEKLTNIIETVFVIGGQQVYEETLKHEECTKIYVTRVQGSFNCDAFFPEFTDQFTKVSSSSPHNEGPIAYHFEEYERKSS